MLVLILILGEQQLCKSFQQVFCWLYVWVGGFVFVVMSSYGGALFIHSRCGVLLLLAGACCSSVQFSQSTILLLSSNGIGAEAECQKHNPVTTTRAHAKVSFGVPRSTIDVDLLVNDTTPVPLPLLPFSMSVEQQQQYPWCVNRTKHLLGMSGANNKTELIY